MSPSLLHLKTVSLVCLALAGPLCSAPLGAATEKIEVSRAKPSAPNEPLHAWFKEQDKILDEILLRLGRVEKLVQDLQRLVAHMPGPQQVPGPATAAPAPPRPAPVAAPMEPGGAPGLEEWLPQMAGGLVLVLLLLWFWRRRRPASGRQEKSLSTEAADTAGTDAAPARELEPVDPEPMPAVVSAKPSPVQPAPAPAKPGPAGPSAPLFLTQNDEALELAEIMLSMGLGHGAAQTLVEKIEREPKQALLHWLKLLEIYRQSGQQAEFEQSAEELRKHFNVQPEDWHALPGGQRSLEDYPHIAARMVELWGKPSCHTYLKNLLDDNRQGARAGFPQSVAEELVLLTAILKAEGLAD